MDMLSSALILLPERIRNEILKINTVRIEEIRLRAGRIPTVLANGTELQLETGALKENELNTVLERATGASLHAYTEQLREGYISHKGLRIGISGTGIYRGGLLQGFKNFSSLNIRIPAQFCGNITTLMRDIRNDGYGSLLILSPPGGGKTTLLREIIRCTSNDGMRISVVDDRNELAAAEQGRPYFDLGTHSDVMTGVRKNTAAMQLLRAMNPQIIAMDEISRKEDVESVFEIAGCGVSIFVTAHGKSREDLNSREIYRRLMDENIFRAIVIISSTPRGREYMYKRIAT